jgi:hypothetical protein
MLVAIEIVLLVVVILQVQHLTAKSKPVPARVPRTRR